MSGVEFLPQEAPPPSPPAYDGAPPESAVVAVGSVGSGPSPGAQAAPPQAAARRRRFWPSSLTARLVSGVVILVLFLVCAIGSITYVALRSSLDDRLNQQVISTAGRNAAYFEHCQGSSTSTEVTCPTPTGPSQSLPEWVALLNADGSVAASIQSGPLNALTLSRAQRAELVAHPNRVIAVSQGAYDLRVTASAPRQFGPQLVIVTGLSTEERDDTLGNLLTVELVIGLGAIVLAFASTYLGVRHSLRNLYRVTGTAQEVAAELSPTGTGLDRRVPVADEGSEVGQLAESFNTMLAAVETQFAARLASEQRMRQFLADASHELRTPLTSIRGFAELARMQRVAGGGEANDDNLDRIESEGTRMSRLVDDLLLLARGETDGARPVDPELIDLGPLLDDVVTGTRAAFPGRLITAEEIGPVPAVLGDRDQLVRVVRNLVTNAAVHTAPERPIAVRTFADAGGVVVAVRDGGPGLPPEQAAHVFERFWRADKARTRSRGGSGLGMSIVAAIVRAHGGTVRFDSSVEGGSTAVVWLPPATD
ncbi:sensor histidine kinase [uncultured Jatrophihabitans sp.]|uniref:sensor histidine kinase n=1 Tax=uncultured Jatrophihabitans sp. TaxID=1610747 RepID=UPI0035CBB99C